MLKRGRVAETEVSDVRVGGPVDITVDAFPGITVAGRVAEIQASTAAKFSFFPGPDTLTVRPGGQCAPSPPWHRRRRSRPGTAVPTRERG
jgi:hypothetical protein